MDKSAIYRIRVQGELSAGWSSRLADMADMRTRVERNKEHACVTTLEGPVRDQAALSGVLNTLYELHLPVLSVECLNTEQADGQA
jgi:hypothetical protein